MSDLQENIEVQQPQENKVDNHLLFIEKYKPEIFVSDPLFKFRIVNSEDGQNDFYCYYHKKNLKIYFAKDCPLGAKVFDKDEIEYEKIDSIISFCSKFLEEYKLL